jgi:hypothetical protein
MATSSFSGGRSPGRGAADVAESSAAVSDMDASGTERAKKRIGTAN